MQGQLYDRKLGSKLKTASRHFFRQVLLLLCDLDWLKLSAVLKRHAFAKVAICAKLPPELSSVVEIQRLSQQRD